jgi:hypothetical protein
MNKKLVMKSRLKKFRPFLVLVALWSVANVAQAQYQTIVEVTHIADPKATAAINRNSSLLLTELNNAQGEQRSLSLTGIDIDKEAASDLFVMWEVCPFRCDELEIVEAGLNHRSTGGYQIRNIPIIMEPRKGERFDEDKYQEIVLTFDKNGKITNLAFSLGSTHINQILRDGLAVTDLRRRSMVVDFVEQFRTAYNRKDMAFLQDIYSDDALIITGKVVQRKKLDSSISWGPEVELSVQGKKEYLNRLSSVFKNSSRINVVFDDVKVSQHKTKDNIYGVKLVQYWNTNSYSDKGYLFLLWDFSDEDHPQIHVRTWQPFDETDPDDAFDLSNAPIKY